MKRLTSFVPAGTLVLTSILLSPLASGGERLQFSGSHPGVQSIKLTNAQVDYFFIGDLRVENDAGADVASPTEATFSVVGSTESFASFGSTSNGGINDSGFAVSQAGAHSATSASGQAYVFNLNSPQTIEGEITMWNRNDGCCQGRMNNIVFEFYDGLDGTGTLLASILVSGHGADAGTPDGYSFAVPFGTTDTDGDGMPDDYETVAGLDPNDNGSTDPLQAPGADFDADGIANLTEFNNGTLAGVADTDADGFNDNVETNSGFFINVNNTGTDPLNPDTDCDGLLDGAERNTGVNNGVTDSGTNPHAPDTDVDGLMDGIEIALGIDPNVNNAANDGSTTDFDNDGAVDRFEILTTGTDPTDEDSDDDGLLDGVETNNGAYTNPSDTGTDPLNPDTDGDTLLDGVENNSGVNNGIGDPGTNPNEFDTDFDGLDDPTEIALGIDPNNAADNGTATDFDNDGAFDADEIIFNGTDPFDDDTDDDGLLDGVESNTGFYNNAGDTGTDPLNPDTDGDGLLDGIENASEAYNGPGDPGSDPNLFDSDSDGIDDGTEVALGLNPNDFSDDGSATDFDSDGAFDADEIFNGTDPLDDDTDDDGYLDGVESFTGIFNGLGDTGTDPLNPDTDLDGLLDGVETGTMIFNGPTDTGSDPNVANTDGDDFQDGAEAVLWNTDPSDAGSFPTGGTIAGVKSIRFTNLRPDWFYIEEIQILNDSLVDVASFNFDGGTGFDFTYGTANSGPAFGSTLNGPIDDASGGCCGTGWHSAAYGDTPQVYTMTLPTPQTISGYITMWDRSSPCCRERLDGFRVEYFDGDDGTGNLLGSQDVTELAFYSANTIGGFDGTPFPISSGLTPSSELRLTNIMVNTDTGEVSLTWDSELPPATYSVVSGTDLTAFPDLINGSVDSGGDTTTLNFTDPNAINDPSRYYAVRTNP